jgi:hypothetical protein
MNILTSAVILFLLIFASTAIITLLSLIGKVKTPEHYRKQLFRLLIVEVVGIITAFVANNLRSDQTPFLSEDFLLQGQGSWDWNYPEKGWRATMRFHKENGALTLIGTTYYVKGKEKIPVIDWKSSAPITLPGLGKKINFKVTRCLRYEAVQFDSLLAWEVGKKVEGQMQLDVDIALRGSFTPDSATQDQWGVMMTRVWQ